MITAIEIENFKGIGERAKLRIGPVTLLFGPNSAGKSSIIHAIHYLRELFVNGNIDAGFTEVGGNYVDLGGFDRFIHNRDTSKDIKLAVTCGLKDEMKSIAYGAKPVGQFFSECEYFSVELTIGKFDESPLPKIKRYDLSFKGQRAFSIIFKPLVDFPCLDKEDPGFDPAIDGAFLESVYAEVYIHPQICASSGLNISEDFVHWLKEKLREVNKQWLLIDIEGIKAIGPLAVDGNPAPRRPLFSDYYEDSTDAFGSEDWKELERFIDDMINIPMEVIKKEIDSYLYLGPLREQVNREFSDQREVLPGRWATGIGAWDYLHKCGDAVLDRINDWLHTKTKLNTQHTIHRALSYNVREEEFQQFFSKCLRLEKEPIADLIHPTFSAAYDLIKEKSEKRTTIEIRSGNLVLSSKEVGVGLSQIIPVVTLLLSDLEGVMAIEQPELHVHPKLQSAIGDLLLEGSRHGKSLVVETHSEHVILRILRRIRQTYKEMLPNDMHPVDPSRIFVHYVKSINGQTVVSRLRIDETGQFMDDWPDGFFDERMEELLG